jgi:hypothetical protein
MEVGMESLPEVAAPTPDPRATRGRQFSGGRVLGAAVAILAVLLVALLLTRSDDKLAPSPVHHQQSTGFALTNSEAIAKFKELNHLRIDVYRSRDPSLITQALTSDSPCGAGRTAMSPDCKLTMF